MKIQEVRKEQTRDFEQEYKADAEDNDVQENVKEDNNVQENVREYNVKQIVDFALDAGRIILKSGGEISRVEETITRICNHFGVVKVDIFTLSHGIFVSAENERGDSYTRVQHIPLSGTHLGIVAEVNQLSREIAEGKVRLPQAIERLEAIKKMQPIKGRYQMLGAGAGAAGFGFLVGATITESLIAFCIGCIVQIWVLYAGRHKVPQISVNLTGGALITVLAIFARYLCTMTVLRLNVMIIAGIMPLMPGIAFINAIRDIADSDFLSGTVRMINALLIFLYIAIGVGLILTIYNNMSGGFSI